jgi:hypothetical protein
LPEKVNKHKSWAEKDTEYEKKHQQTFQSKWLADFSRLCKRTSNWELQYKPVTLSRLLFSKCSRIILAISRNTQLRTCINLVIFCCFRNTTDAIVSNKSKPSNIYDIIKGLLHEYWWILSLAIYHILLGTIFTNIHAITL